MGIEEGNFLGMLQVAFPRRRTISKICNQLDRRTTIKIQTLIQRRPRSPPPTIRPVEVPRKTVKTQTARGSRTKLAGLKHTIVQLVTNGSHLRAI